MNSSDSDDLMLNFLVLWDGCVNLRGKGTLNYDFPLGKKVILMLLLFISQSHLNVLLSAPFEGQRKHEHAYLLFAWWLWWWL